MSRNKICNNENICTDMEHWVFDPKHYSPAVIQAVHQIGRKPKLRDINVSEFRDELYDSLLHADYFTRCRMCKYNIMDGGNEPCISCGTKQFKKTYMINFDETLLSLIRDILFELEEDDCEIGVGEMNSEIQAVIVIIVMIVAFIVSDMLMGERNEDTLKMIEETDYGFYWREYYMVQDTNSDEKDSLREMFLIDSNVIDSIKEI